MTAGQTIDYAVPFNRSDPQGRELEHIATAVSRGQIAGDEIFSKKCQSLLELTLGTRRALVTTSCTHALEMAALLLELKPGDEVIVPDFAFVSTANAFALHGATPVFCDIRRDTLNLDEAMVEALVSPRTRAIVPLHYAGVGCEMDAIHAIATRHGIAVVEDNAHGLFGKYKGRWLGTFGNLAAQSFHATKNITCGEGGALLINDEHHEERAGIIREKGTDRGRFFNGQVDKYSWVDVGSSYVMSDLLAAFLFGQLETWPQIQHKRQALWQRYDRELQDWAPRAGARAPVVPGHCGQAWHMYHLLARDEKQRDALISHLGARGIMAVFHYQPLHLSKQGMRLARRPVRCPVSENVSRRLLRLPFYTGMTADEQTQVIEALHDFPLS